MHLPCKTTLTKNSHGWMDPWINGSNNIVCHLQTVHLSFTRNGCKNIYGIPSFLHCSDWRCQPILESNPSAIFQTTNHLEFARWKRCASWFPGLQLFCDDMCQNMCQKKWTTPRPLALLKITDISLMILGFVFYFQKASCGACYTTSVASSKIAAVQWFESRNFACWLS
jgi:hypothetical protein